MHTSRFLKNRAKKLVSSIELLPKAYKNNAYDIIGNEEVFNRTKSLFCAAVDVIPFSEKRYDYYLLADSANHIKPIEDNLLLGICRFVMDSIVITVSCL